MVALTAVAIGLLTVFPPRSGRASVAGKQVVNARMIADLNGLSREINQEFGIYGSIPLVNCGPCGRFAKIFRDCWQERFGQQLNFVFVMTFDKKDCLHILVRLPDGSYFDGGLGVMSRELLDAEFFDAPLVEQEKYDLLELDERAYGLIRPYPDCPKFDAAKARQIVHRTLTNMRDPNPARAN